MNILWLSHLVPYPPTGLGVLQRSYNLIREVARKHRVFLLGFIQRNPMRDIYKDPESGLQEAYKTLGTFCEKVQFLPTPIEQRQYGKLRLAARSLIDSDPYTINWLKSVEMAKVARTWRDKFHFDLVHFDTISLAPYLDIFASHVKTLDHHNIESHMMLRRASREPNWIKRIYYWQEGIRLARYEARVCPQFDLSITCSPLDSARLRQKIAGIDIVEIPNGVDLDYFKPYSGAQEPTSIVFAGNMSWYPNRSAMVFFAERVWPLLCEAIPQTTMHVIGAHPPPSLLALAERDSHFKVYGFVPDPRPYIDRAAVYVCPIMDGGGTKLKVLDALAMGKPLVATPVACEGIDVVDGETVLFACEPEEYVERLKTLFLNRAMAASMGAKARLLVQQKYSYTNIGLKLVKALERCVEKAITSQRLKHLK